jgi:exosortase F-associated protein
MNKCWRWVAGVFCTVGLVAFFLGQGYDYAGHWLNVENDRIAFFVNRTLRFLVNDGLAIGLIYALFWERKYLVFALWVQLGSLVFLLIPYFVLKYHWPSYNGPLINFLHRLVLNPTLLILLIPAFYYQQRRARKG